MRRVLSALVMAVAIIAPALTWEINWMWSGSSSWVGAGVIVVSLLIGAILSGLIAAGGGEKGEAGQPGERRRSGDDDVKGGWQEEPVSQKT